MLGALGVIVTAVLIWFINRTWNGPIFAIGLGLSVLPRTRMCCAIRRIFYCKAFCAVWTFMLSAP